MTIGQSNENLLNEAINEKSNIILIINKNPQQIKNREAIEQKLNEAIIQIAEETQATNARFEFFLRIRDNAATNDFLMNKLDDTTQTKIKEVNKAIEALKNEIKFLETSTPLNPNDNNDGLEMTNRNPPSVESEDEKYLKDKRNELKNLEKKQFTEIYNAIKEDFHTFTSIKTPSGNHIILCTRPDEKDPNVHHKIYKVQQTTFNWMFGAGRSYQTQLREDWILLGLKIKADGIEKPTINIDPKYTHDEEKSLGEALRIYEGLHRAGYSDEDITIKMYVTDRTFNPNEPQSDKNMPYKKIEFSATELESRCNEADQLKFNKRLVNKYNSIMKATAKPYNQPIEEVNQLKKQLQDAKSAAAAQQEAEARSAINTTATTTNQGDATEQASP